MSNVISGPTNRFSAFSRTFFSLDLMHKGPIVLFLSSAQLTARRKAILGGVSAGRRPRTDRKGRKMNEKEQPSLHRHHSITRRNMLKMVAGTGAAVGLGSCASIEEHRKPAATGDR
ncbi:MAG: twin-arginine translocation signal domain-containing protein, partial [Planctomycetota bacterium]